MTNLKIFYSRIFKIFDDLLSGERSLSFGLLVHFQMIPHFSKEILAWDINSLNLLKASVYLLVIRTCMKTWMISKFSQILPATAELAALERLKKKIP